MKTMKSLLLISAFLWSVTINASAFPGWKGKEDPFSEEITRMLSRSSITIEEDLKLKVIFVVTREKKIEIRSISSTHSGVKTYIEERLNGQQLKGNQWDFNKVYELPVRIKAIL